MFVPVACLKCGKLFQVPDAAAGTEVACPWCQGTTPALPVAAVAHPPVADAPGSPAPTPVQPEPLSLDDAEAVPAPAVPPPAAPRPPVRVPVKNLVVGLLVVVVGAAATLAVLRYGSGHISPAAWGEFTAPDGSFRVALPGTPTTEALDPVDTITRGGERYVTTGWYSRASVWAGFRDLDPGWAKQARADRDGALTTPVITAERDRRAAQVGGTVAREADVRFGSHTGRRVEMDTPRGKLVEWYIVVPTGPRPRLYVLGIEAKNLTPDGPAATRLFNSFRILE